MFLCGTTELFATMEFLQQLQASTYSQVSVRWEHLFCGQGAGEAVGAFGASVSVQAALGKDYGTWARCQPLLPAQLAGDQLGKKVHEPTASPEGFGVMGWTGRASLP